MGAGLRLPVTMPASDTRRFEVLSVISTMVQVMLFGCGGLIHAAVGLVGGMAAF